MVPRPSTGVVADTPCNVVELLSGVKSMKSSQKGKTLMEAPVSKMVGATPDDPK